MRVADLSDRGGAGAPRQSSSLLLTVSPDDIARPISAVGPARLARNQGSATRRHRKSQMLLVQSGLVECEIDQALWIVPARCALWIPGLTAHSLNSVTAEARVCLLYVDPHATPALPRECCTCVVPPLLEGLLQRAMEIPQLYDIDGPDGRLMQVLLDQLVDARCERLTLPMPRDPRLRRIAEGLISCPAGRIPVASWARRVGAAERTLTRLMQRETGMSFGRWRRQLHVLIALQRLAQGVPVQTVALDLGYRSAGVFISLFHRTLASPPASPLARRA